MYHPQNQQGSSGGHPKRRKKRPIHGLKTVEVTRGKSGYGFTISGQHPCILSNIVKDSPAERAGLKAGDYLVSVNNLNISKAPHDDVVRMVGTSTGTLILQVAENYNSSDSSDDEYHHRTKARYPNRIRQRHGSKHGEKILGECNQKDKHNSQEHKHKDTHFVKPSDPKGAISKSRARLHTPIGAENNFTESSRDNHQFAGPLPVERRSASQSRSMHVTPIMQRPQAKQAIVKSTSQSAQSSRQMSVVNSKNHYGSVDQNLNVNGNSKDQKSIVNNSISSLLKTSVANNSANNAFIAMEEDDGDDEESLLNQSFHDTRVIVGYIGSLEMPSDADKPHIRIQSIRNAVRRLRVEQKIHILVLMEVSSEGVKLTNSMGTTVAHYPVDRIAFSGITPDDKRFFGIVTLHSFNDDDTSSEAGSQDESVSSGSCHVFMVDPEIKSHNIHAQKAKSFGITCTPTPDKHHCAEFPKSATPVILCISNLYKDRPGVSNDNELALSQAFTDPSRAPQRSHSNSSNSDSGLGFGREEARQEQVLVVDMPPPRNPPSHNGWGSANGSIQHCSPDNHTIPTPRAINKSMPVQREATAKLNQSTLSEDWGRSKRKLDLRAMADLGPKSHSSDGLERQNSAENLRASMRKLIEQRQRSGSTISSDQESNTSNVSDFQRSLSQPDLQSSRSASTQVKQLQDQSFGSCPNNSRMEVVDIEDDRLSPRAILPPPFHQLRSPSAPPAFHCDDSFDDIPAADTSGMCSLIERFEQDHAFRISSPADISRRFSDGTPIHQKQRDKSRASDDLQDNFAKPQPRTRKLSRLQHPFSHSHESLVTLEQESNNRLSAASSVNNITNNGDEEEQEDEIGRIAGWAVNFNKLLNDHSGLAVFTEFLKKEFSQENILFWRTCEQYKHIEDSDKRKGQAKEIFVKYMSSKATEPVNIEHVTVKQVEKQLDSPNTNTFEKPQQEIFKLMKQDSYPRFIKSDLYKTYLMREMEGKPLNLPADDFEGCQDKKDEKNKSKIESKEKRRRSLLPWRGRSSKQSVKAASDSDLKKSNEKKEKEKSAKDKEVNNNTQKKTSVPAGPGIDLSTMRKEATKVTNENEENNFKFCRVIMPDGSTTVVCARPGQTIRTVLGKLCEKRSLSIAGVDVFLLGSDKPLDLSEDISTLGSKEVMIERRVLFRMDLPNRKSIGVKAKPNRTIRDVFKPILNKYGFKLDNIFVQLSGKADVLDIDEQVSTIDNQRVVILQQDDIVVSGKTGNIRSTSWSPTLALKYPPDYHNTQKEYISLDVITNSIFDDLMKGKSQMAHNFDELGILDPDNKVKSLLKNNEDRPSLGLFGLKRKESAYAKDPPAKTKSKHKVTFNLQKNQTRTSQADDDRFLELLSKAQRQRLDDQRGLNMNNSEIPEFLRNKHHPSGRESAPPVMSHGHSAESEYVENSNNKYSSYIRDGSSGRISSMSVEVVDISADDSDRLTSTDQSFSQDGIIPSTSDAQDYFQSSDSINADFDDPCLAEKNLRDIGFDYSYNMYQAKAWGYSRHRPMSPSKQTRDRAPVASPDESLLDNTISNDDFDDKLTSSPVNHNWRPRSVPPVLAPNKNGVLKQLSPLPMNSETPGNISAFRPTSKQKQAPPTLSTFTSTPKQDNKPVILDLAQSTEDITFV